MRDPVRECTYNLLYQDLKKFSKNGEHFCKELMIVFQQRAELETSYAKGLQKLAGKLVKALSGMGRNSTYNAWSQVSDEMYSMADIHRTLGNAFQQDAIVEIRQILDEHTKRKRPLDGAVEKTGKIVVTNWNEQLKIKKKLIGLTREHEALFSFVENNKQICTEKEKQKMLNRLTKSAEAQARSDEEYFNINMAGLQSRLKWETTVKNCYQIIQELEKQRIEILSNILHKYSLYMSSFGQTIIHCQKQMEEAITKVDVEKDIQTLVEETTVTTEDMAEFLLVDYFEEDSKTVMGKERRKEALGSKLQRLQDNITRTKKDLDGLERMVKTYTENPSFSNKKNLEETEQLLDETTLKLGLLEATSGKLSTTMAELEGKPKLTHRFSDSIKKWKEKDFPAFGWSFNSKLVVAILPTVANIPNKLARFQDFEHSVVQLARPVKIKKTPFRSRMSMRSTGGYAVPTQSALAQLPETQLAQEAETQPEGLNGRLDEFDDENENGVEVTCIGKCKALYDFSSDRDDELNIKEGDLLDILQKDDSGWWFGTLNGLNGHFPSTYVEELPTFGINMSSDV